MLNDPSVLADDLVKLELGVADVVGSVERADCQVRPWNMILVTYFKFKGRFQLPFLILDFGFPSTISNTQDYTYEETKPR